jgi:hypothetical protein
LRRQHAFGNKFHKELVIGMHFRKQVEVFALRSREDDIGRRSRQSLAFNGIACNIGLLYP